MWARGAHPVGPLSSEGAAPPRPLPCRAGSPGGGARSWFREGASSTCRTSSFRPSGTSRPHGRSGPPARTWCPSSSTRTSRSPATRTSSSTAPRRARTDPCASWPTGRAVPRRPSRRAAGRRPQGRHRGRRRRHPHLRRGRRAPDHRGLRQQRPPPRAVRSRRRHHRAHPAPHGALPPGSAPAVPGRGAELRPRAGRARTGLRGRRRGVSAGRSPAHRRGVRRGRRVVPAHGRNLHA